MSRTTMKSCYGFAGFAFLTVFAAACSDATNSPSASTTGGTTGGGAVTTGGAGTTGTGGSDGGSTSTSSTTGSTTSGTTGSATDELLYTFDDGDAADPLQGWVFNDYQTGVDDAGVALDPNNFSKKATVSWDAADGHPNPGSMKLEIPFSAYNQKADFHHPLSAQLDLSNKVLSVWAKLDSGFSSDPSAPGGLVLYIKTGTTFAYAQPMWHNVDAANHNWVQYFFDVKNGIDTVNPPPADFDPTKVVEIGFYIHTGGAGDMPDAHVTPMAAVFHIDSFGLRNAE